MAEALTKNEPRANPEKRAARKTMQEALLLALKELNSESGQTMLETVIDEIAKRSKNGGRTIEQ